MNILDDVTRLEDKGYLQLNSDESTDTSAPKLPQQCMARWCGRSSNRGWAPAIFGRMDHTLGLRLLGYLWYSSMRLVPGNCVMFPREYRRMFD
jgi:hypothetical protein